MGVPLSHVQGLEYETLVEALEHGRDLLLRGRETRRYRIMLIFEIHTVIRVSPG